jgi:predicted cation transporter
MTRYLTRDRAAIAAALVAPLAAAILLPFRASWPNTNVALLLVVVVVAVADGQYYGRFMMQKAWPAPTMRS